MVEKIMVEKITLVLTILMVVATAAFVIGVLRWLSAATSGYLVMGSLIANVIFATAIGVAMMFDSAPD